MDIRWNGRMIVLRDFRWVDVFALLFNLLVIWSLTWLFLLRVVRNGRA